MQVIDENTVVVTTSEELNKVLSEQNNYTYIYLGNDITMSSGLVINNTKEKIIIDNLPDYYEENRKWLHELDSNQQDLSEDGLT